jgi:hypothetical protein
MKSDTTKCLALLLFTALTVSAATSGIGTVRADGNFRVNNVTVPLTATVFDGSGIETSNWPATAALKQGARVQVLQNSRVQLFADHLVLERGATRVGNLPGYTAEAQSLRVSSMQPGSEAQIESRQDSVIVQSLRGSQDVRTTTGLLIARVSPGKTIAFQVKTGSPSNTTHVAGVLETRDNVYVLTDGTSGVTIQLIGNVPTGEVGKAIDVEGTLVPDAVPAGGATQVVRLTSYKRVAAAAVGGHGPSGSLIAGVAIVAAGGAAAAGFAIANSGGSTTSR